MDFALTDEQTLIVDTARRFTENELMPHEEEVERAGAVRPELVHQIRERSIAAGIYACLENNSLGLHLLEAAVDDGLVEFEVGDAVAEQAADAVGLLEDGDGVSRPVQLLGCRETGRHA